MHGLKLEDSDSETVNLYSHTPTKTTTTGMNA
jgi:hypothetical protein